MTDNAAWHERILVLCNDSPAAEKVARIAQRMSHEVRIESDLTRAETSLRQPGPTIIMLGSGFERQDAIAFLKSVARVRAGAKIVILDEASSGFAATLKHLGEILGLNVVGVLSSTTEQRQLKSYLCNICPPDKLTAKSFAESIKNRGYKPRYNPVMSRVDQRCWEITDVEAEIYPDTAADAMPVGQNVVHFASEQNLLMPLFDSITAQIKEHTSGWRKQGLQLRVAINLCPEMLTLCETADNLDRLVSCFDLTTQQVTFEINEGDMNPAGTETLRIVKKLRNEGFTIALDGFRGDKMSIEQLLQYPFNCLKIDPALIRASQKNRTKRALLEAIMLLSRELGYKVCATGVDSGDVYQKLSNAGCDYLQGRAIGPAQTAASIPEFIASRHTAA